MKRAIVKLDGDDAMLMTFHENGAFEGAAKIRLSSFASLTDFDTWLKGFQDPGHLGEDGDYIVEYYSGEDKIEIANRAREGIEC